LPVAMNCWLRPMGMLGVAGVTLIDCRVAAVTVSVVLPETEPSVAVIVLLPAATALARPFEPAALLTVATLVLEEDQVADDVRFCVD
jgi:hypothetical protein